MATLFCLVINFNSLLAVHHGARGQLRSREVTCAVNGGGNNGGRARGGTSEEENRNEDKKRPMVINSNLIHYPSPPPRV